MKFTNVLKKPSDFFKKIPVFFNKIPNFFKSDLPEFLKENFEVASSKKSKIIGAVICAVTLLTVIIFVDGYLSKESSFKWFLLAFGLASPFILGLAAAYTINIKNERLNKVWYYMLLFIMPIITVIMTERLNDVFVFDMYGLSFLGNYLVVLVGYFIFFVLTGSLRITFISATSVFYGFALAHCYVMQFRGTPFTPMDFYGISTAAGVANTYNYAPNYKILNASLIFIFILIVAFKTKTPNYKVLTKIISKSTMATFCAVLMLLFYGTDSFSKMGVVPNFWNPIKGYRDFGFVLNYFLYTDYLRPSKPKNYNHEKVPEHIYNVIEDEKPEIDNSYTKPNIICIMNESLSDLSVLGEFETNEDYMPFMRSLTENTVKGNLYVPVIGAGTSNTEFEFLTGHTTAFLPSGSNAYMLYVENQLASIVSTLEVQGYSSHAIHPYYAKGWQRTEVYNNFGFDKFTSLENIIDISLMDKYFNESSDPDYFQQLLDERYPGKNMIIRQYISDSYNYKLIMEDFEKRDKSKPYFTFNVTMQNHGGYTTSSNNFDECIYTTSTTKLYDKTNKYLSLVKASDNAFKELINYFKKVKEPTIICMFGDHQPSVESEFITEIMGVESLADLDAKQEHSRHCTPFFIWANYDIEEKVIDKLSSNYLSSLVLQTAGVKLTEYDKYLLKLSETLPVIDTVGYVDNQDNYYMWSDASPYTKLLNDYEKIQYNGIFDIKNLKEEIFYIDGYVPPPQVLEEEEE